MRLEQLELLGEMKDFRLHKKYREGVFKTRSEIMREMNEEGRTRIFSVLSFGGGTQSTHLMEMHLQGEIDYDYIIFSDTGAEPEFIHEQVRWWQDRQRELGNTTPFIITRHSSMDRGLEEMLMRYIHTDYQRFQMPVYCNQIDEKTGEEIKGGLMPRQCTVDFKIVPVQQAARKRILADLGLGSNQRMPSDVGIIMDIGFSYDEMNRINLYRSPQYKYISLSYPLVEENMTTEESIQFLKDNNMPDKRSRCYLCPFNCDSRGVDWREIIVHESLSFLKACYFDEQLRKVQKTGRKNMKSVPYFHYSRMPLKDAYPEDYEFLSAIYKNELDDWISSWSTILSEKYGKVIAA
ncbi:hypothetical protein IRB79_27205 (plasmid) [Cytobacillus oceanisediminis]|nr:hypothetical protein IRB79_27205 [Cytobacillus oceanisediminis]